MIAIVNNCERFRELAEELKERWWKPGYRDNDADIAYNTLISTYKVRAINSNKEALFRISTLHFQTGPVDGIVRIPIGRALPRHQRPLQRHTHFQVAELDRRHRHRVRDIAGEFYIQDA